MNGATASTLRRGEVLLLYRFNGKACNPPNLVVFEKHLPKTKKTKARMWVKFTEPNLTGGSLFLVNVRDVEVENPLQRIANKL